jgi:hypothetical protein
MIIQLFSFAKLHLLSYLTLHPYSHKLVAFWYLFQSVIQVKVRPRNARNQKSILQDPVPSDLYLEAVLLREPQLNKPMLAKLDSLAATNPGISPGLVDSNIDDPDQPLRITTSAVL